MAAAGIIGCDIAQEVLVRLPRTGTEVGGVVTVGIDVSRIDDVVSLVVVVVDKGCVTVIPVRA